jgi:hypothetical protein
MMHETALEKRAAGALEQFSISEKIGKRGKELSITGWFEHRRVCKICSVGQCDINGG